MTRSSGAPIPNEDPEKNEPAGGREPGLRLSTDQKQLVGFLVVLAVVNIAYRLVYASGMSRTAALYVGIPTMLAVGLALLPRTKSATGALLRGTTIAVLAAAIILPEGFLCLLFALPLVALISVIIGGTVDWARRRDHRQGPTLMAVTAPLLLLSLEGVVGSPFDGRDSAMASVTVKASPAEVAKALAKPPRFDAELPLFLTIGFNRPVGTTGSGIEIGDQRTIEFTGGTHDDHPLRLFGLSGERSTDHHSTMHLSVVESQPGRVVFAVEHDATMLSRWADLHHAVVTWEPVDDTTTRVSWRLDYERLLSPTVYFAPVQRYGMDRAADYLLSSVVADQLP